MSKIVKMQRDVAPLEKLLHQQMRELEHQVGGRHQLIMGLLATDDEKAKQMALELQKAENQDLDLYSVCQKMNTSLEEVLKTYSRGELVKSSIETLLTLARGMPAVMEKSIEVAREQGPAGYKDREMLMKMSGLLKGAEGIQLNLNQNIQQTMDANDFKKLVASEDDPVSLSDNPFIDVEVDVSS